MGPLLGLIFRAVAFRASICLCVFNAAASTASDLGCDAALTQALVQAASHSQRVLIQSKNGDFTTDNLSRYPNSRIAQLKIRQLNKEQIDAPRAREINRIYGLQHGVSPIFFIEIEVRTPTRPNFPGDIESDFYDFLLINGYVGITNPDTGPDARVSFLHDLQSHVTGYLILSGSPLWPEAIRLLKESRQISAQYKAVNLEVYNSAHQFKREISTLLERDSGYLSDYDREGKMQTVHNLLKEFESRIQANALEWDNFKKLFNLYPQNAPPEPLTWRKMLQELIKKLIGETP